MKFIVPFIAAAIAFFIVLVITPYWIRFLRKIELVVKDQNKQEKPLIPISGGIIVMIAIIIGLFVYIFGRTFFYEDPSKILEIVSVVCVIFAITLVGFLDDLVIKGDKNSSSGLKQWQKPIMTLFAAIPLVVINAGESLINVPFFGTIEFGLLYPLLLVPIGVVGAANMVNLLAGYNGLETGLGIISIGMLGLYAYVNNIYVSALIALISVGALLAFYYYNKFPAKIFPGDSLTYLIGATLACIAIVGNMEKAALICSIPFIIEFLLKARSRFKAKSYGEWKDGKIISLHGNKIYSIPHIFSRTGRYTEKQIVNRVLLIELICASLIWII